MQCTFAKPDGAGGYHCQTGGQYAGRNVSAGVCRGCPKRPKDWIVPLQVTIQSSKVELTEEAKARLEICKACQFFSVNKCVKCGCGLMSKVNSPLAHCPVGKW